MEKSFYRNHPEVFQGEKKLNRSEYFEGWYFKNTSSNFSISFIPGIHIHHGVKKAFIQIITATNSYYINYDFDEFQYQQNPFYICIGNSLFSMQYIHLDIDCPEQNLTLKGELHYSNSKHIQTSKFSPNIMGPFSYLPFMECNHGVLSMKNTIDGSLHFNQDMYFFNSDIGYIEKDWGSSFPQSYLWCEANHFSNPNSSLFLSVATIPLKVFSFTGFICSVLLDGKEYRFATYNNSKLLKYQITSSCFDISLKHKADTLLIHSDLPHGLTLKAPVNGQMQKDIRETITSNVAITLKNKDTILYQDSSSFGGLEIV